MSPSAQAAPQPEALSMTQQQRRAARRLLPAHSPQWPAWVLHPPHRPDTQSLRARHWPHHSRTIVTEKPCVSRLCGRSGCPRSSPGWDAVRCRAELRQEATLNPGQCPALGNGWTGSRKYLDGWWEAHLQGMVSFDPDLKERMKWRFRGLTQRSPPHYFSHKSQGQWSTRMASRYKHGWSLQRLRKQWPAVGKG